MNEAQIDPSFVTELRKALRYLYDPVNLRRSILTRVFHVDQCADPGKELRNILVTAIEALKPSTNVPPHAEAWRIYNLLLRRYIEQFSQLEVASELNLSPRHVRREESNALNTIAHSLWADYHLENQWSILKRAIPVNEEESVPEKGSEKQTPTQQQEMDYLNASLSLEPVDLGEMLKNLLQTVQPLAQASSVQIHYNLPPTVRHLAIRATTVRQAFLITMSTAISHCVRENISIDVSFSEHIATLLIRCEKGNHATTNPNDTPLALSPQGQESLKMAQELFRSSGGSLELLSKETEPIAVNIVLPLLGQKLVLVVDDNTDTQLLLQRYLTGSPYQFIGVREPQRVVELALKTSPQVIVLDVMLPGIDGWELLDRLREHPTMRSIPVIVCTILPQESLALTLGAAAFIRKPVSQEIFLAVLNRLLAPSQTSFR